jgi:DNA (cytosine-5)-methyltransferase 1
MADGLRYLSLFSGMEAAGLAWKPLGWQCVGVAEIDPAACAVLAHQYPDVPNLGDICGITGSRLSQLGRIDVVIGGSPCQDLSVAGRRAGLVGARSGLFHEQLRVFDAARIVCGARWLVWENVPGAFSSNSGRDFALVVGSLAGTELPVPEEGWGSEGVALGPNGLVEWSVLDAQWFGVAQRRRRVFAVLDTGSWSDRPPVLLEPESLRGDHPPRREARENPTGTLTARNGSGGVGVDDAISGALVAMAHGQAGAEVMQDGSAPTLTCLHEAPIVAGALCAADGKGANGQHVDDHKLVVTHTLRAEGFDASEDGTGRGVPLVPVALSCKDHGADAGEVAPTLRAMGDGASHANAGGQVAVASSMAVRRLTPRECERLQGAPDDWTLVPNAKGKPMADGPRYKMIGNSFAVPVIRWIGVQIQQAHYAMRAAA